MPPIVCTRLDFATTPLARAYATFFAQILDNVFTPSECSTLIALAESTSPWESIYNPQPGREKYPAAADAFRNSHRILRDDQDTAAEILRRIRPFLGEVEEINGESRFADVVGKKGMKWSRARGERGFWRLTCLNERLRFLRYGPGERFKPHCDGLNDDIRGFKSFLTVHLYLNDGSGLAGGQTRFWTPDKKDWIDVEPVIGRVLVFQQRMLVHSGEMVTQGWKFTVRTDVMFEMVVITREERKKIAEEERGRGRGGKEGRRRVIEEAERGEGEGEEEQGKGM